MCYFPQKKIEANLQWNPETAEYQMNGVAYTGNNMRKHYSPDAEKAPSGIKPKMKQVYLSYSKMEKPRPQTSYVPRPRKARLSDSDTLLQRSLRSGYADAKSELGPGPRLKSALLSKGRMSGKLDHVIIRPSQDGRGDSKSGAIPKTLKSATPLCKV